jgi:Berberine and berberine like
MEDLSCIHTYTEQNAMLNPMLFHGPRSYTKGFGFRNLTVELLNSGVERVNELVAILGEDYRPSAILFEAFHPAKLNSVPDDATAFGNRGTHLNCVIVPRWGSPDNDVAVRKWVKDFVAEGRELDAQASTKLGREVLGDRQYANILMVDDKIEGAFQQNLPRLQELKAKWDPLNRFNKWLAIPPARAVV